MPVSSNKETGGTAAPENNASPIRAVMRSKGFMWLSSGHATAFYWSHAGQHFEIRCALVSATAACSVHEQFVVTSHTPNRIMAMQLPNYGSCIAMNMPAAQVGQLHSKPCRTS